MDKESKDKIRAYALLNAVKFNGKANPGAVIGKMLSEQPELKDKLKEMSKEINIIVKEVNALVLDEQLKEIDKLPAEYKEEKKKEKKEDRDIFAFLKLDPKGVVSAFPPGPEKYPHIGHAKALLLNYLLAKQYDGKFLLRFEDTNPNTVKEEFYEIMLENFKWLGVEWDELLYASDHMQLYYDKAEELIKKGDAYICFCSGDKLSESRMKSKACECRDRKPEENIKLWKEMQTMEAGEAILRMKIDLAHKNTTMRDPTIFRIIDDEHPRLGKKFRVWPNYDIQNAIMDSVTGVTIRLRSKEFEMRNELQRYIQERLGLRITRTYEFARFNMVGVLSSGRVIREKVQNGELIGWDDPGLTTIVALRRRGFLPEAIKNFVISTGMTKAESTLTWDDLIMHNKRLLDEQANRYFMIVNAKDIVIKGAPKQKIELNLNPNQKKGGRELDTAEEFIIENTDYDRFKEGEMLRLMDCVNFKKNGSEFKFDSVEYENFRGKGNIIIHWLPKVKDLVTVEILMPDKTVVKGIAEPTLKNVKIGDVIQFERYGFCRLDSIKADKYRFWFTHK